MSMKQTMCEFVHGMTCEEVSRFVGSIVRCRDCRYYNEKTYKWVNGWTRTSTTCALFDSCHVEPDGFCAWGERKVVGE